MPKTWDESSWFASSPPPTHALFDARAAGRATRMQGREIRSTQSCVFSVPCRTFTMVIIIMFTSACAAVRPGVPGSGGTREGSLSRWSSQEPCWRPLKSVRDTHGRTSVMESPLLEVPNATVTPLLSRPGIYRVSGIYMVLMLSMSPPSHAKYYVEDFGDITMVMFAVPALV